MSENELLLIVARLVKEYGPKENWPTRQFGLGQMPEIDEVYINARLLQRMHGDDPKDLQDEELDYWTEGTKDPYADLPESDVTKRIKARRAKRRASRRKHMRNNSMQPNTHGSV